MSILSNDRDNRRNNQRQNQSIESFSTYESYDFLELVFQPRRVFKYLITIIFCLVTLNLIGIFYQHGLNGEGAGFLVRMFSLDAEANVPSIYSTSTLLVCSVLLAVIAKSKNRKTNRYRLHWKFLALIFLYLAIDEGAKIHEKSISVTRNALNTSGFLHFAWVIPAIILFSLFSLIYLKFVLSLPQQTRFLFILCAATFVGGAIGMEMIGAKVWTLQGEDSLIYALTSTVEETLEMVGIAGFIYTLLDYIKKYVKPVTIRF